MAGTSYTLAAVGRAANQTGLSVLTDDLTPPEPGNAKLRVIGAAPNAPTLDVRGPGGDLALGLPYAGASGYRNLPAGATTLVVGPPGGATVDLPVTLAPNQVASVVLVDRGGAIAADLRVDAEGPTQVPPGAIKAGFGGAAPGQPGRGHRRDHLRAARGGRRRAGRGTVPPDRERPAAVVIAELPAGWLAGRIDPSWPLGLISAVLAALLLWPVGARLGLSPASRATAAPSTPRRPCCVEVYAPVGVDGRATMLLAAAAWLAVGSRLRNALAALLTAAAVALAPVTGVGFLVLLGAWPWAARWPPGSGSGSLGAGRRGLGGGGPFGCA